MFKRSQCERSFEVFFQNFDGTLEFFIFFIGQMEFDNVFYAVLAYFHRYGSKAVMDAVFAVQIDGAGKDFMFIVVNGPDQLGNGGY